MFRAIPFSSSGGQIVLLQHLLSSLTVNSYSVHRFKSGLQFALNRCTEWRMTIPDAVTIQFDLLKMSMVLLETCLGL